MLGEDQSVIVYNRRRRGRPPRSFSCCVVVRPRVLRHVAPHFRLQQWNLALLLASCTAVLLAAFESFFHLQLLKENHIEDLLMSEYKTLRSAPSSVQHLTSTSNASRIFQPAPAPSTTFLVFALRVEKDKVQKAESSSQVSGRVVSPASTGDPDPASSVDEDSSFAAVPPETDRRPTGEVRQNKAEAAAAGITGSSSSSSTTAT
ncbi:unnamed protein product [Amoebophrya sp. A120]|nr:unnamed protein product [Amoebophrya sp. A120]|eukprot:GSA120T00016056001.1